MPVSNLTALCFAMGQQGGTVHQVAHDLGVEVSDIINADNDRMDDLLRMAQAHGRKVPADRAAALDAFHSMLRGMVLDDFADREEVRRSEKFLEAYLMQHASAPVEKVEGLAEALREFDDLPEQDTTSLIILKAARLQLARQEGK